MSVSYVKVDAAGNLYE